ncbi:protein 5NUC-like [Haemaphysalis longicornis]
MSSMGYNYVCLGNHEFDDGPKNLAPFLRKMKESHVTVVGTNTDFSNDSYLKEYNLVKSVVTEIRGRKIGILGAVIPSTKYISSPGPDVEFYDEIESFNKELVKLKQQKVNIIIAITHSGFSREINIVDKVTEIDVLVGGHTNTFLYTGNDHPKENKPDGPYPYVVNRTGGSQAVVVQEYWFGKFLGKLELTFDEQGKITSYGGNPILLDANVKEDVCMVSVLKPFKEKVAVQMERNIGATKVCMEHAEGVCRLQECNLGNLIADSFFHYYVNRERRESAAWSTLNGAVVNSGGIRTALPSFSNITWGDVVTTLPYGNSLVTVTLNGSLLWRMFEHSVFNYTTDKDERRGRFLQVSDSQVKSGTSNEVDAKYYVPGTLGKYDEVSDVGVATDADPSCATTCRRDQMTTRGANVGSVPVRENLELLGQVASDYRVVGTCVH